MTPIELRNYLHRKSFTFPTTEWEALRQVAVEQGYPNRNQFLIRTLRKIIADHNNAKSHDLA